MTKTSGSSHRSDGVAKQAGRMGVATFFSRIGGLVREQVFAFWFGASDVADAFNIAFRIPNLLRDLFAEGAMSAAFVPKFTQTLEESKQKALRLLLAVLWTLLILVSVISIVGAFFSPELVGLYGIGFKNVMWKFDLTVSLTRMMFPFFPMVAMAAVCMGALNALGFFFLPAFAPVLFNVASIFAGLVVCPVLLYYTTWHPIYGMAVGVVLGGFLQFYIQWRKLRKEGLSFSLHGLNGLWLKPWKIPGVKEVLWLLIPGTLGLAATQFNILINSIYASTRGSGAVSWLNYAFRLMQFPIGIFGVSLAAATLPRVSRLLKKEEAQGELTLQLADSLRLCVAVNFSAAAGLMAIALPLIQIIFQHGHFQIQDSEQTATALFWYSLGLPGYSVVKILGPIFYAIGTTRVPVISSFILVALNALLNSLFVYVLNLPFWALALATSVTATLNALILFYFLSKRIKGIFSRYLFQGVLLYFLVACGVWFASTYSISFVDWFAVKALKNQIQVFKILIDHIWLLWFVKVLLSLVSSLCVWLLLGKLFQLKEIEEGLILVRRKLERFSQK